MKMAQIKLTKLTQLNRPPGPGPGTAGTQDENGTEDVDAQTGLIQLV
jgi:hypothetical protein